MEQCPNARAMYAWQCEGLELSEASSCESVRRSPSEPKDKTGMIVGIGVGVIAVVVLTVLVFTSMEGAPVAR